MNLINEVEIVKYKSPDFEKLSDKIIIEKPLNIFINNQHYVTLMCTPSWVEELGVGFLFAEDIISSMDDINDISVKNDDMLFISLKKDITKVFGRERALVSGCNKGSIHISMLNEKHIQKLDYEHVFQASDILKWANEFNTYPTLFQQTGGVHSCCICGENGIEMIAEDIGRHNALDKLIGRNIKDKASLREKLLFTSGRISSDILVKTARAGISVLVSHSAPTDLVVRMAKNINMTLIGFARGKRMNIYSGYQRIMNSNSE
jgi:FdhD protein